MSARTGAEFLEGLRDDRAIWVGSERVRDVASHPACAGAARGMAALFDLQHEAADVCLMPSCSIASNGSSSRASRRGWRRIS